MALGLVTAEVVPEQANDPKELPENEDQFRHMLSSDVVRETLSWATLAYWKNIQALLTEGHAYRDLKELSEAEASELGELTQLLGRMHWAFQGVSSKVLELFHRNLWQRLKTMIEMPPEAAPLAPPEVPVLKLAQIED